jgi:arginase
MKRVAAVTLIGLPYLHGTRTVLGGYAMAQAPGVLLAADAAPALLSQHFADVMVEMIDADDPTDSDIAASGGTLFPGEVMSRIQVQNRHLGEAVRRARAEGRLPIAVVATCTGALGTLSGLDGHPALLWFDAHDDAATPDTTASGLIEGMPVSMIAGQSWPVWTSRLPGFHPIPPERIVEIGLHDAFDEQDDRIRTGIGTLIDPPLIAEMGLMAALDDTLDCVLPLATGVFVHVDVDCLDTRYLRANKVAVPGGLSPDDLRAAFAAIAAKSEILAFDFSAFDPSEDPDGPAVILPLILAAAEAMDDSRKVRGRP